jgi:TRAP-type C4-dicarboxylate transport system permease small subunit
MSTAAALVMKATRWLDDNVERYVMLGLYGFIAAMVGGEAILRYITGSQTQWGATAAIHAFIFLSWIGCAYHVHRRSHIRFDAIRKRLSLNARFVLHVADDLLWLAMAAIVIHYSIGLMEMHRSLGATLEGTDHFPYWIAVAAVPVGWVLVSIRAVQDLALLVAERSRGELRA